MLPLLERFAGDSVAAPVIFLVLFLVIVGGALWLTPQIARWIEKNRSARKGYFDGMKETEDEE